MNKLNPFFNLYCINMHCKASIYQDGIQTRVIFDVENLTATHICTCCRQHLFSAMDIEIEQVIAEAGMIVGSKPYYSSNN